MNFKMKKEIKNTISDKITPLVIAKNTLVAKNMTEREYKLVHKVSENWIKWIKKTIK